MPSRFENAKESAMFLGSIMFIPGAFIAGWALYAEYAFSAIPFQVDKEFELAGKYDGCIVTSSGVDCWKNSPLANEINRNATDYGVTQGRITLSYMWPAIVAPCLLTGFVVGGIYGFLKTPTDESKPLLDPEAPKAVPAQNTSLLGRCWAGLFSAKKEQPLTNRTIPSQNYSTPTLSS